MPAPTPSFSYTPNIGAAPLTVVFTDSSTGSPDSWSWDFGDGGTSTDQNPTHTYVSTGTYDVTLEVSNVDGSNIQTFLEIITVEDPALYPVVEFTASPTSGSSPLTVNFTDQSLSAPGDPIDYWQWDLVSRTDYTQNPSVTYSAVGTRTISLTVRGPSMRESTLTKTNYITVTAGSVIAPVANFSATPTTVSVSQPVQFYDQSTNTPTSWAWDFDNSGSVDSTAQNPTFSYAAAGTYAVKLTVTNSAGSDIEVKLAYITVTAAVPVAPTANFTATPLSGNAPLSVTFTDTSTGSPTGWSWDFTNDGVYDSTEQNPTHVYSGVGTYSVKLRVTNAQGSDTETKPAYITVVTAGMPVADFTASPTTVALGSPVSFTDTSFGTPTAWAWDFDNSGITDSTVQNPSYTYLSAGTKTVRLTVTNATGSDYEVKTAYITVTSGSGPSGNISIQQGTTSTNTPFVKGSVAAFYDPTRNWVRYGKVFSVTYLSDPTYKILHKAYYVPRIIQSNSSDQDYTNRKGLVALNEHTTSTSLTVETIYQRQGVTVIPAATGSYVTATSVTSAFKVGDRVSALVASLNVIVLGRVSAIRYINNDPNGTDSEGYFRYYIKSWGSGPSGPILRTYSTDEEFVNVPGTTFSTFVALGRIPTPPMKSIVISPIYIQGGGTAGSNTTDLLPKTYNIQLSASGGIPPYTWDVVDGSIMTGCNLSTSGLISGTATAAGTFQFKVRATDSDPEGPNEGTRVYLVSLEAYTGDQNTGGNLVGQVESGY